MNLYPTFSAPVLFDQQQLNTAIPSYGTGWNFDLETGEFILDGGGNPQTLNVWDTWRLWCIKAVITARNKFLAYSNDYGSELDDLVGSSFNRVAVETELRRMISETLKVNPKVKVVDNFQFTWEGNIVSTNFRVWPTVGQPIDLGAVVNG